VTTRHDTTKQNKRKHNKTTQHNETKENTTKQNKTQHNTTQYVPWIQKLVKLTTGCGTGYNSTKQIQTSTNLTITAIRRKVNNKENKYTIQITLSIYVI
jgi:hypothetical protein